MEQFEKWPLLASTQTPEALKALSKKQLPVLAAEIRDYLVYRTGENGGHLASNLGAVELTMAIHRVFNAPDDHIIFDVGHQSYVHKLLTGRGEQFDTLRVPGGLSGFTKRTESAYDPFGTGHSSTAISAAIGMARADLLSGKDTWTVAVVGDGALTGGLAFEGLNNCDPDLRLIVVINENEMSISPNTGRLASQMSHMRASRGYIRAKETTVRAMRALPLLGKPMHRGARRVKRWFKHALYRENVLENMDIRYIGPIDGNDVSGVEEMLRHAKKLGSSVILHVKTVKGKGYAPAEADPAAYHALQPRDTAVDGASFSQIFGEALCEAAERDERVVAITAAMRDGTGLVPFVEKYPERFFDVGIAEGHAVTFAAGLAAGGKRPVVAIYSTFLNRAYDNILHDAALQGLGVVLCIDRAGLNAHDGATHHGVFDVAMLSALPDVRIYAPVTARGLALSLEEALAEGKTAAIRYPAGAPNARLEQAFYKEGQTDIGVRVFDAAKAPVCTIVTHGKIAAEALTAVEELAREGIAVRVLLCEYLAPYDTLFAEIAPLLAGDRVIFLEEEVRHGGFGMNLADAMHRADVEKRYTILASENGFITPAMGQTPLEAASLGVKDIKNAVLASRTGA